ncbi:hypothetical protein JIP62_10470 [Brevundimonas vitis]|uniref:DUF4760 domain-containing protein n=1 Tax=Brevundimonas vitisensis TaxID=2800818 RepID=A0ABX7BJL6_9CAUL|nr:hypothetical protein [Brevundimonas vitisensis]QQQ17756.1 hypothetical protein JIP62_10470 [Brevundimonas vitisensis]
MMTVAPSDPTGIIQVAAGVKQIVDAFAPLITVVGALGGVWLGSWMQTKHAAHTYQQQRIDRLDDERRVALTSATKAAELKAFSAYRVATLLEAYAKDCARKSNVRSSHIDSFTFPDEIDWVPLGPLLAARVRDFETSVELVWNSTGHRIEATDRSDDTRMQKMKRIYEEAIAKLGLEAWELAVDLRQDAGLPELQIPPLGWNFIDTLRSRIPAD